MTPRHYIGIDPGLHCGWAVLDRDGNRVASGTWGLRGNRLEGSGMYLVRLAAHFSDLLQTFKDPCVAIEEVAKHKGVDAAHVYGAITGMLTAQCERLNTPCCGAPVATVKRHATGKGNAGKPLMIETAQHRWRESSPDDWTPDDNEADALWIADALLDGLL